MISPLEGRRENSVKGPPSNRSLSTNKRRSSSSRSTNSSSSANTSSNRNNSRHSLSDNEDRQASDKSVGSMKTEKVAVPQEDIRSVCRWIQFFCGSTDGKVCISEVEELILYPPFLNLDERYEVSGPMLSFQGMLQRCGMNPQEWYEFVMRHDPVFSKTPVMMLPTFTKAMIKMCNEVSVSMMSDAQIRVLYRYFVGSYTNTFGNASSSPDVVKGSPALVVEEARPSTDFLCFNYVDEGFSAFDFAIAFAKHSVQDTDVIASYNQIAHFVHQWGTYLKETHMDLTVIGGITSKSMKAGILTIAELEKVLSNLYVKHQQYLRQMSRPGMNTLACNTSTSIGNPLSTSSSTSSKQQPRDVSTLGAAEDELLPENDDTPIAIPQRKRSMLNSVVDLLQNVRASFSLTIPSPAKVVPVAGATGSPSNHSAASTAQTSAVGSRASRKGQRRPVSSAKGKASIFPVNSGHSAATTVYSDSQYTTAGEEFTALHDIVVADTEDEAAVRVKKCCVVDEEERAERRRRRSVKHPLRYSALFTAESVTPSVSATTSEGSGH